ncbi:MAG: hypothetical protein ABI863_04845 [Ginsengibacter sp.]
MAPQFLIDIKGKKTGVFLSMKDYRKLMDDLDELEDIKAYDKAKTRNEKTIPLRDAIKLGKKNFCMSKYTVVITQSVQKYLKKSPDKVSGKIESAMIGFGNKSTAFRL